MTSEAGTHAASATERGYRNQQTTTKGESLTVWVWTGDDGAFAPSSLPPSRLSAALTPPLPYISALKLYPSLGHSSVQPSAFSSPASNTLFCLVDYCVGHPSAPNVHQPRDALFSLQNHQSCAAAKRPDLLIHHEQHVPHNTHTGLTTRGFPTEQDTEALVVTFGSPALCSNSRKSPEMFQSRTHFTSNTVCAVTAAAVPLLKQRRWRSWHGRHHHPMTHQLPFILSCPTWPRSFFT